MNRKKGSILLLVVIIASLLFMLTAYLISLVEIEYLSDISVARYEKMKLTAESGIDRGLAVLKQSSGVVPAYPNNKIQFNNYNDTIKCLVEIGYTKGENGNPGKYTISSKVSTQNGKYNKNITAFIEDTGFFKRNFYFDKALFNTLTIIDEIGQNENCPITFNSNSKMNLNGSLYIQGSMTNLNIENISSFTNIFIKSNDIIINNPAVEKDRIYVDIPEEKYSLKDNNFKNIVSKSPCSTISNLNLNFNQSKLDEDTCNLLIYKLFDNTLEYKFSDIDNYLNEYIKSKPLINCIDQTALDGLDDDKKKDLAFYVNSINFHKLLFVKGNITIDGGNFNNYLIFCTGKITVNNSVNFNNSSIFCNSIELSQDSNLTIYPPDRITIDSKSNSIKEHIKNNISNYYDAVEVKIENWVEE